jgi:hypothetical protein
MAKTTFGGGASGNPWASKDPATGEYFKDGERRKMFKKAVTQGIMEAQLRELYHQYRASWDKERESDREVRNYT